MPAVRPGGCGAFDRGTRGVRPEPARAARARVPGTAGISGSAWVPGTTFGSAASALVRVPDAGAVAGFPLALALARVPGTATAASSPAPAAGLRGLEAAARLQRAAPPQPVVNQQQVDEQLERQP